MEGLGIGDVRTEARGAWLFERIVATGSVVLSAVGGSEAGTASAHRYLTSPRTTVGGILKAFGRRTARACAGRPIVMGWTPLDGIDVPEWWCCEPPEGGVRDRG